SGAGADLAAFFTDSRSITASRAATSSRTPSRIESSTVPTVTSLSRNGGISVIEINNRGPDRGSRIGTSRGVTSLCRIAPVVQLLPEIAVRLPLTVHATGRLRAPGGRSHVAIVTAYRVRRPDHHDQPRGQ